VRHDVVVTTAPGRETGRVCLEGLRRGGAWVLRGEALEQRLVSWDTEVSGDSAHARNPIDPRRRPPSRPEPWWVLGRLWRVVTTLNRRSAVPCTDPPDPATFVLGALLTAGVLGTTAAVAATNDDLLRAPIQGSILSDPPLFGANRGGAPWQNTSGEAKVQADGTVKVSLVGLVIPGVGTGAVRTVTATVACNDAKGPMTAPVTLSPEGNAEIKETVTLPTRCLAPAVLIHPNGNPNTYIAATGH
jgi:hypothetical protein